MSLRRYLEKRDFTKTPEPESAPAVKSGNHRFVIQKHAASHLHYDFRLEVAGTLKSWAVPKGIPYAKGEKRLAMHVEDHPISYRDFEGIIPKGQYGGGTVMVWDYGTFTPKSATPAKDLAGGKLHFVLKGKKLSGEWYLVRLKNDDKQWLLIRGGEDLKPISKKQDDTSALSGKSMKALAAGKTVWNSNRSSTSRANVRSKGMRSILRFFEPMMAKLLKSAPGGDWQWEIKYDGFRALAFLGNDGVRLISRNGKDLGVKFPEVVNSLQQLHAESTVLDGEIVALDKKGRSSFQLLQSYELGDHTPSLAYYVFDLPQHKGEDLRSRPLADRQAALRRLLQNAPGVLHISSVLDGDGDTLLKEASKLGLEGLIGKRRDSVYESGRRSGAWIKLKTHREQEFVIGGFTDPAGARQHFGALLVGVFQNGSLVFTGKVGTGFNDTTLRFLNFRFRALQTSKCPFKNLPDSTRGRYGSGITRAEVKRCHWLKPVLVCELKFSEWTRDGKLRQPVFLGLREDKNAREVVREEAA